MNSTTDRRHELARHQQAARVAEHAQLQREAQLVVGPRTDSAAVQDEAADVCPQVHSYTT